MNSCREIPSKSQASYRKINTSLTRRIHTIEEESTIQGSGLEETRIQVEKVNIDFYTQQYMLLISEFLLQRARFYLIFYQDNETALRFLDQTKAFLYRKEVMIMKVPFFLQRVKVDAFKIRIFLQNKLFFKARRLIESNLNLLQICYSMLMNDCLYAKKTDDPKVRKVAKYTILTLIQSSLSSLINHNLIKGIEGLKFIDWIADTYFEDGDNFMKTAINYCNKYNKRFKGALFYYLETIKLFEQIIQKNFNIENEILFDEAAKFTNASVSDSRSISERKKRRIGSRISIRSEEKKKTGSSSNRMITLFRAKSKSVSKKRVDSLTNRMLKTGKDQPSFFTTRTFSSKKDVKEKKASHLKNMLSNFKAVTLLSNKFKKKNSTKTLSQIVDEKSFDHECSLFC